MEITRSISDNALELKVTGRLDGYWANHLSTVLSEEIRRGSHHILLDLAGVAFLSSAGIGILVRYYKELEGLQGSFRISKTSDHVKKILDLSALTGVLTAQAAPAVDDTARDFAPPVAVLQEPPVVSKPVARISRPGGDFEVHPLARDARLTCRLTGDPACVDGHGFTKEHARALEFSDSSFAIGLGALGEDFEDCRNRFGEFIVTAGAVAYLPTDGTNVPDYFVSAGRSGAAVQVGYCLSCEGPTPQPFAHLIRFEADKDAGSISFAQVLETCLEVSATESAGIVMIAESAGLVGAALRASPSGATGGGSPFEFPGIRNWLTFTAERAYTRSVALVAGVAVRGDTGELSPMLRPLGGRGNGSALAGHFHAAAFSYRPIRKGEISLKESVKTLYIRQSLEGVLHLLNDDREIAGAGQSEFVRGACWVAPIEKVVRGNA